MRGFRLCCLRSILAGVIALGCSAQSDRGTITGRVVDPTDSVVISAAITVLNQNTGVWTVTHTNQPGNYVVRELPFGKYELSCQATGFRKYIPKDVEVALGQTLNLDFKLEL